MTEVENKVVTENISSSDESNVSPKVNVSFTENNNTEKQNHGGDISKVEKVEVKMSDKGKNKKSHMNIEVKGSTAKTQNPYEKTYSSNRTRRSGVANYSNELECACLADWSTFEDETVFWSFGNMAFLEVKVYDSNLCSDVAYVSEDGFRAVTENVPKTFYEALHHPLWGEPARKEWGTVTNTNAIVEVDSEVALNCIKNHDADLVVLFPVYEIKMKDGILVRKVRLVGDGRTHYHAGNTYAATPSREELLILLHVIAALNWDYAHVDEIRAFLNAEYKGGTRVFTKLKHENMKFYEIKMALYGLRTSPKDYQEKVIERLTGLGFKRLAMCGCMYIFTNSDSVVLIYDFVDDFIFTGNIKSVVNEKIMEMRSITSTTEPIWNAENVLGMHIVRNRTKRTICITIPDKIEELHNKFDVKYNRKIDIPMPVWGYIIKDEQFENLTDGSNVMLDRKGIETYMAMVGSLIWISSIRFDILFTVMYLSWSTKAPKKHHLNMAMYCIEYLFQSKTLPLVLGGNEELGIDAYTDASLGTAVKGRSVIGHLVTLGKGSGAIYAKSTATQSVVTSSFEAELIGLATAMKSISRVTNILVELKREFRPISNLYSDNKAMVEFVHGKGVAKGVRHMELNMWQVREHYLKGTVLVNQMPGIEIPSDKLTKLGNKGSHGKFTYDAMGISLLDEYHEWGTLGEYGKRFPKKIDNETADVKNIDDEDQGDEQG